MNQLAFPSQSLPGTVPLNWIKTVAAAASPERLTRFSVSSITQTAGVAICTINETFHWKTGMQVWVEMQGADQDIYNNAQLVTVTGASTFTFPVPSGTVTPATGVISGYVRLLVRQLTLIGNKAAGTGNTGTVYIGAGPVTQVLPIATGAIYTPPVGGLEQMISLGDIYVKVANAGDGLCALCWL